MNTKLRLSVLFRHVRFWLTFLAVGSFMWAPPPPQKQERNKKVGEGISNVVCCNWMMMSLEAVFSKTVPFAILNHKNGPLTHTHWCTVHTHTHLDGKQHRLFKLFFFFDSLICGIVCWKRGIFSKESSAHFLVSHKHNQRRKKKKKRKFFCLIV